MNSPRSVTGLRLLTKLRLDDSIAQAIASPESFASTLLVATLDTLGWEVFTWTPEAIKLELAEATGVVIPSQNMDRLQAAINLITTDDFSVRLPRFIRLANILSGDDYDPEEFDPADADEIAWAVTESALLDAEHLDRFQPEILAYICEMCRQTGLRKLPQVLSFAQEYWTATPYSAEYFNSDPGMYKSIQDHLDDSLQELEASVVDATQRLFRQLGALKLQNGKTENLLKRVRQTSING